MQVQNVDEPTNVVEEPVVQKVDEPVVQADPTEKYKNDMFKYKRELQAERDAKAELERKLKQQEEDKLKTTNNYKKLYEQTLEEKKKVEGDFNELRGVIVEDRKFSAIKDAALKAGMRPEAVNDLRLFDSSDVILETTSEGNVNVLGAELMVENLKKKRPYLFTTTGAPPVNNSTGKYTGAQEKTYSPLELLELEKTDNALYKDIMQNKQHLIRR